MNIKKQVVTDIKEHLARQQSKLHYEIRQNKREMHKLVEKQTKLKRSLPYYSKLIKELTNE